MNERIQRFKLIGLACGFVFWFILACAKAFFDGCAGGTNDTTR